MSAHELAENPLAGASSVEYTNNWNNKVPASGKADYLGRSLNQFFLGNLSDDTTLLGTAAQIGLGMAGLDLPMDIRDLTYDLTNWEWMPEHIAQTLLDAVGFLPVIGSLKYADEFAGLLKNADEIADLAKRAPELVDLARGMSKIATNSDEAADWLKNTPELADLLNNSDELGALAKGVDSDTYNAYLQMLDDLEQSKLFGKTAREYAMSKGVPSSLIDEEAEFLDEYRATMKSGDAEKVFKLPQMILK